MANARGRFAAVVAVGGRGDCRGGGANQGGRIAVTMAGGMPGGYNGRYNQPRQQRRGPHSEQGQPMTLTKLLELSHRANYVHHPVAIMLRLLDTGQWVAELCQGSPPWKSAIGEVGESPDAALSALEAAIIKCAKRRAERAAAEAAEARTVFEEATGAATV